MIVNPVTEDMSLDKEERHIKNAWIAGIISTVITFAYSLAGAYDETIRFQYGFDTWTLLDVALIAGLTFGIYKKNRYCALGLLIYFVGSKFIMAASTGQFSGGFVSLLFAYFFFQGTRAAFKIHKHNLEMSDSIPEKGKKGVGFYIGIVFASILIFFIGYLIVIGSVSPEIEVIPGKQVNREYLNFVWEEGIVDRSEKIQYWYSDGFGDFKDGFYLFTDKKVVVYNQTWGEPAIIIPYDQITKIEFEQDPSFFEDSRIFLSLTDDTSVFFPVSSENGGDDKFYDRLMELWRANVEDSDQ